MENAKELQKQECLTKKAYHSPKLRACGSVKERTKASGSTYTVYDGTWYGPAAS